MPGDENQTPVCSQRTSEVLKCRHQVLEAHDAKAAHRDVKGPILKAMNLSIAPFKAKVLQTLGPGPLPRDREHRLRQIDTERQATGRLARSFTRREPTATANVQNPLVRPNSGRADEPPTMLAGAELESIGLLSPALPFVTIQATACSTLAMFITRCLPRDVGVSLYPAMRSTHLWPRPVGRSNRCYPIFHACILAASASFTC
jgi:hypothetical protein